VVIACESGFGARLCACVSGGEKSECAGNFAQVGEWLKPTDCKSVPPSEVRRFESFPVHQDLSEPIISSVGRVRRLSDFVVDDNRRSEDSIGDAGDFGDVRGENVSA
jgi:hypothetical protein